MKLWQYLFGHKKRIGEYQAELERLAIKRERIQKAYALHREVLHSYGLDAYSKLTDAETIIEDDKSVNVINYLNI